MKKLSALVIPFILVGCQSTGEEYRASWYQVASLNQKQAAKTSSKNDKYYRSYSSSSSS